MFENGREESSLVAYPHIKCNGNATHMALMVLGIIMFVLYVVMPSGYLSLVSLKSRRLFSAEQARSETAPKSDLMMYQERYHFLLSRYGTAHSWWYLASLVRNTAVSFVPLLFSGKAVQVVIYSLVLAVYGSLIALLQPWIVKSLTYIESLMLLGLACVSAYFIVFMSESERIGSQGLVAVLGALVIAGIAVSVVVNIVSQSSVVAKFGVAEKSKAITAEPVTEVAAKDDIVRRDANDNVCV